MMQGYPISVQYAYETVKGTSRKSNKDGIGVFDLDMAFRVFAIFDGVSSLANAKHGVNLAIRELKRILYENKYENDIDLVEVIKKINKKIRSSKYIKPYTTCALLTVPRDKTFSAQVASLGDSRIYGIHSQFVEQLTDDHNISEYKNMITRYLGMDNLKDSDIFYKKISGDYNNYILCTDGFYSLFENDITLYHNILLKKKPAYAVKAIRELIKGKNQDDASYIYVRVGDV